MQGSLQEPRAMAKSRRRVFFSQVEADFHAEAEKFVKDQRASDREVAKLVKTLQLVGPYKRRRGRPRKSIDELKCVQIARFEDVHGIEATMQHFGIKFATVERAQRKTRAIIRRGR
jgi:hypothetical protein